MDHIIYYILDRYAYIWCWPTYKTHLYIYIYTYIYTHIYIHIYTYIYALLYRFVCVCVRAVNFCCQPSLSHMLPGTTLSIACACCDSLRIPSLVFSLSRLRFSDAAENSHVLIALHLGTLICLSFEHTIAQVGIRSCRPC